MGRKRGNKGLRKRGDVYHIEKQILGVAVYESCHTGSLREAEAYLAKRTEEIRKAKLFGQRPRRLWREAAIKYINENGHKRSIGDDALHLQQIDEHIGKLYLDEVHDGSLAPFVEARLSAGIKTKSINLALGVVRRILNLSARSWRDKDTGLTWIAQAPAITMLTVTDAAKPYPLDWDEQTKLFKALPGWLSEMCLYKVNVGPREQEVCGLRWDWEVPVPEIGSSVFLITDTKNGEERLHVLNDIARSVVEKRRSERPATHLPKCLSLDGGQCNCARSFVFTYRGYRLTNMNVTSWSEAWAAAGLPVSPEWKRGVHNLRHTCGRRLRAAGVPVETRKAILGHTNGDITTHYSAAEIKELIDAVNRICRNNDSSPALTLVKRRAV